MEDNQDEFNPDFKRSEDFDEKEEIAKLQEKIKRMTSMTNDSEEFTTDSPESYDAEPEEPAVPEPSADLHGSFLEESADEEEEEKRPKKFVVTADVDYVEYFDKLSVEQRSELFNELLGEYIKNEDFIKGKKRFKKILIHLAIAFFTIIIAIPILFFIINKSIHYTVLNYKNSQVNFEKLYESQGVAVKYRKRK